MPDQVIELTTAIPEQATVADTPGFGFAAGGAALLVGGRIVVGRIE